MRFCPRDSFPIATCSFPFSDDDLVNNYSCSWRFTQNVFFHKPSLGKLVIRWTSHIHKPSGHTHESTCTWTCTHTTHLQKKNTVLLRIKTQMWHLGDFRNQKNITQGLWPKMHLLKCTACGWAGYTEGEETKRSRAQIWGGGSRSDCWPGTCWQTLKPTLKEEGTELRHEFCSQAGRASANPDEALSLTPPAQASAET